MPELPFKREYDKLHGKRVMWYFRGDYYTEKGWCVKAFALTALEAATPSLEEKRLWESRKEDIHVSSKAEDEAAGTIAGSQSGAAGGDTNLATVYAPGDFVCVTSGELLGFTGEVSKVDGQNGSIQVKPADQWGVEGEYTFQAHELRKLFPVGTHVKVLSGTYTGETGHVVGEKDRGDQFVAIVHLDSGMRDIEVFVRDLQKCFEVSTGLENLGGFSLFDVVVTARNMKGIVVRVAQDSLHVLEQSNNIRDFRPSDLRKPNRRMIDDGLAIAHDNRKVQCNDIVTVLEGPKKGFSGTIRLVTSGHIFVKSNQLRENAGVFVVPARSVKLSGARSELDYTAMSQGRIGDDKEIGGGGGRFRGRGHGRRRREIRSGDPGFEHIGKVYMVKKRGPFKGFLGTCTFATKTHIEIELHSRAKKISFLHEEVELPASVARRQNGQTHNAYNQGNATPGLGAMSPGGIGTSDFHSEGGMTGAYNGSSTPHDVQPGDGTPYGANDGDAGGAGAGDDSVFNPFDIGVEAPVPIVEPTPEPPAMAPSMGTSQAPPVSMYGGVPAPMLPPHHGQLSYAQPPPAAQPYAANPPPHSASHSDSSAGGDKATKRSLQMVRPDVVVRIIAAGAYYDREGVVEAVDSSRKCTVRLPELGITVTLIEQGLRILAPKAGDRAIVLSGEFEGRRGKVTSIYADDNECVLTLDGGGSEMEFISLDRVGKLAA
jgi:transcription elongation factor SPT5